MQDVKTPITDSWKEAFIESLKDPEEAAVYLEVALEEENPEPQLLLAALEDIIKAFSDHQGLPDETLKNHEKLCHRLTISGCAEIYGFVELLHSLGFKLSIQVQETELK